MNLMYLATESGLVVLGEVDHSWALQRRQLTGQDVNVVTHRPGERDVLFAGTYGNGLFRTTDGGQHWRQLALDAEYIRAIVFAPEQPLRMYVGTEPANLFASLDGGDTWAGLNIRRLPEAAHWSLPYSPRAGALRSLVLHPRSPGVIYGAVEQGGVLRSSDRGETWSIDHDDVDRDVHWLALHPEDPALLLAATGGGLFRSRDSGNSWRQLFDDYIRAVALHPLKPDLVLAGPAEDVGERGTILFSSDGGDTWSPATNGIESPLPDMIEEFVLHPSLPGTVFAIRSGGSVLHSRFEPIEWRPLLPAIEKVQDLDLVAV